MRLRSMTTTTTTTTRSESHISAAVYNLRSKPAVLRRHVGSLLSEWSLPRPLTICEYPHEHRPPLAAALLPCFLHHFLSSAHLGNYLDRSLFFSYRTTPSPLLQKPV